MLNETLKRNPSPICKTAHATRNLNQVAECRSTLQLIDRGCVDGTRNCSQRTDRRNIENVTGLQTDIVGFIAFSQQVVKIEITDGISVPSHLNVPQRSLGQGTSGSKDCVD